MRYSWIFGWTAGLTALGCVSAPGRIESGHYESERYPLQVIGRGDPASAGLMPQGWKLDNFYGSPLPDAVKSTDAYKVELELDGDGDGYFECQTEDFLYELRFTNLRDDGVVWLRVAPVSRDMKDMQLPVLIESYVQALSGGNYESVKLQLKHEALADKRYASVLTETRSCQLAGVECLLATIELANVDQLKISPTARSRKIQLLIAQPKFEYSKYRYSYPTLLVAGYSNQPARFEAGLPDFRGFLERILIRKGQGLVLESAAVATPVAAAITPSAPAPAIVPAAPPASPSPPAR